METTKRVVILLSLVLFIAGAVQSAEKPEPAKISDTRFASCIVKVTANPNIFPLNFETIESLLRSSRIAGRAGSEVLGLPPERSMEFFGIEPLSYDAAGVVWPEPGRKLQLLGDDVMMDEQMMRRNEQMMRDNETRMMEDNMYDEMMEGEPAATAARRDRSESKYRGRTRTTSRSIDLYGEQPLRITKRPRLVAPESPRPDVKQTLLFRLRVELPEDVKPAAEAFLNALIDNLRSSLSDAFDLYRNKLIEQLQLTETQRDEAQSQLSEIMKRAKAIEQNPAVELDSADAAVCEQLEQIVDLSQLTPEMPFAEAVGILKNSVEPPLKIVVLWRDLFDNAEIEQDTEINMDGIPQVRLSTALELLLKAVSDGFTELGYVVKSGVITIATKDALPSKLETRVYDIPSLGYPAGGTDNLIQLIQDTIEPDSWFDNGVGEGTIGVYMGRKLAILQTPEIHRKIQNFLQTIKVDIPVDVPMDVPLEPLLDEKQDLLREKRGLEMEVARLEARHIAIEEQIKKISEQAAIKVKDDAVAAQLQRIIDIHTEQQIRIQSLPKERVFPEDLEQIAEKLARAEIELAKRREELSKLAGGDQVARFNRELSDRIIELAEKRAELDVVDKQLGQTERQLIMATTFDPQVSQIRLAKQALEIAGRRVSELVTLLADLHPPTVTALGAD